VLVFECIIADALELVGGKWVPIPLHININAGDPFKLPQWITIRGTNSVESYHSRAHHILSGSNNSSGHGEAILLQDAGRANADVAVRYEGKPDLKVGRLLCCVLH
jgi:hypothetical protein